MIEKLRQININLINLNKNNAEELNKQKLIEKILKDKRCFINLDIKTSYAILRDLKIKEEDLETIYKELIDIKNF